jgi:ankyrin repeat protein
MNSSHTLILCTLVFPAALLGQCPSLIDAAAKGDITSVSSLLAAGVDPNCADDSNVKGWTPLMAAAKGGSASVAETLLKAHANVNARNGYGATARTLPTSMDIRPTSQLLSPPRAERGARLLSSDQRRLPPHPNLSQ